VTSPYGHRHFAKNPNPREKREFGVAWTYPEFTKKSQHLSLLFT
jgi:hypothetical protein